VKLRKLGRRVLSLCAFATLLFAASTPACADDVKVMIAGGFASAYRTLGPLFQDATANNLVTVWGPATGTAANAIPVRLARGEWTDVLIAASYAIDVQGAANRIVSGSKVDIARSPIGVAVPAGTPPPDISSADALRHALLAARSIVYPDDALGSYIQSDLFQRLGIAGRVTGKCRMLPSGQVANAVADGQADIGLQQTVELMPVKGLTVAGNLPADLQQYTIFSGAISTNAKNPDGAQALLRFLLSPDSAFAIARTGLEPLAPKEANPEAR
jgi:molybdate transport system substrate-binding protein